MFIGLYSTKICQINKGYCRQLHSNPGFRTELWKNYQFPRNRMRIFLRGLLTWMVMQRSARKDTANWRTKQLNSYTKSQHRALTTTNWKKKWDQLENCLKFAHRWCWHVSIFGSSCRPDIVWSVHRLARAVTEWTEACDKRVARLISYIQTCEYSIAMWETLHNADWDCLKILILRKTLKIENQHQEVSYVFSEATRLCQCVGCARTRLQFHTVLQKLESFLSMQVSAWTVLPALTLWDFGDWNILDRTEQNRRTRDRATVQPVGSCQAKHA